MPYFITSSQTEDLDGLDFACGIVCHSGSHRTGPDGRRHCHSLSPLDLTPRSRSTGAEAEHMGQAAAERGEDDGIVPAQERYLFG